MANRLSAPNTFAGLPSPWILANLDANSNSVQAFANDSSLGFVNGMPVDTGVANAYAITLPFGTPSAYQDGMCVAFIPNNTNTGASTITVSPLGAAAILNPAGFALNGGELPVNKVATLVYKSASPTGFRIVGPCALSFGAVGQSGAVVVPCAGYTSVIAVVQWSSGSSVLLSFQNLATGVPVVAHISNVTGAGLSVSPFGSTPAGVNFGLVQVYQSGQLNGASATTSVTLSNGLEMVLVGGALSGGALLLSR